MLCFAYPSHGPRSTGVIQDPNRFLFLTVTFIACYCGCGCVFGTLRSMIFLHPIHTDPVETGLDFCSDLGEYLLLPGLAVVSIGGGAGVRMLVFLFLSVY